MTGVWVCKSCEQRLGLDTHGQAQSSAPSNWCGAGRHVVRDVVRWAPDAMLATEGPALAGKQMELAPSVADASGQLGLF